MKIFKKVVIVILLVIVLSITVFFSLLLIRSNNTKTDEPIVTTIENDYTMYIKSDETIKINFKEKYHTCKTESKEKRCGIVSNDVINAVKLGKNEELVNYEDTNIIDVVNTIILSSKSKSITITTNWNSRFTEEELANMFKNKAKKIKVVFNDKIDENKITTKKFKVIFDAKNGSKKVTVLVEQNKKVKSLETPKKKGYKFVCWELNGKKYDFNKPVTKDIKLTAKWKKKSNK